MEEEKIRIGELLVSNKIISEKQLENALSVQKDSGKKLGDILIDMGFVDEQTFLNFLSKKLNIPVIDLTHYNVDIAVAHRLPESFARRFQAIILSEEAGKYLVGMVDPLDIFAIDEITHAVKKPIKLALVLRGDLMRALDLVYRRTEEISDFAEKLDIELEKAGQLDESEAIKQADTAVLRLLRSMFEDAVQIGASDIHIEPAENILRIRLRVDGFLQEQTVEETRIATALSQRLKLMAGLNIAEKRLPQDGRFNTSVRGIPIDVRLSTMPTQYGESVVMRLLNRRDSLLNLDEIGMSKEMLVKFRKHIRRSHGLILVTGPTGSGKTTTLYGALTEINDVKKNIITIEDPVEYRLERINQVQVNSDLGLTFARVLRSSLRQDPDIILVGEIRDQETAEIALRSALTGHLVLATLHTNDAASAAIRLIDIGVESYLVAATIRAVLAQRLARRICDNCKALHEPTPNEKSFFVEMFGKDVFKNKFYEGTGCASCNYTGYKGRVGVYELLEFNEEMLDALRRADNSAYMRLVAQKGKDIRLLGSALGLAKESVTSLGEVLRVAGDQE